MPAQPSTALVELIGSGRSVRVKLAGRFDTASTGDAWQRLESQNLPQNVIVDAEGITYCDSAGVALLCHLRQSVHAELQNLPAETQRYMESVDIAKIPDFNPAPKKPDSTAVSIGRITSVFFGDLRGMTVFTGQATVALIRSIVFPGTIRWGEFWVTFEKAGVNALLIVGLIGFLTGMIMAFQSTVPLRQFGVDIFVVNLVALSMLRELGVIMTAIVFAGRTGSAFAAEIGTMKVNEEVNALTTMGLDPVRFLVTPRLLAGIIVMPLLTIYTNVAGVAGGLSVVMLFGHPWAAVWNQLVSSVGYHDVLAGLMKAVVFGFLISGVGCLRGLQTKSGASAVGDSTTSAVVTSIFLIVLVDALFAVIFYATGF